MNTNYKNKGGRPQLTRVEKRSEIFTIKCTPIEKHTIKGKAKMSGVKPAEYIRECAVNGSIKSRLTSEEVKHIRVLAGMANNLNQLAKSANTYGYLRVATEANHLMDEVDNIIKKIRG